MYNMLKQLTNINILFLQQRITPIVSLQQRPEMIYTV